MIEEMLCMTFHKHPEHDWTYRQSWGGVKDFNYHCPGIKKIIVITQDGREITR